MEFLTHYPKKHAGFSLVVVLIISLIGLAVVGLALQFAVTSSGSARTAAANAVKYNMLQHGVEEGKAKLKEKMTPAVPEDAPRFADYDLKDTANPNYWITSLDQLLIDCDLDDDAGTRNGIVRAENLTPSELGRLGIFGNTGSGGVFTVAIYDMQYEPGRIIPSSMTETEYGKLPPSIPIKSAGRRPSSPGDTDHNAEAFTADPDDAGMYLVRATLVIDDEESILDTAVLQANNKRQP